MRVFFTNLGCKLNQAENERLARDFLAAGHQLAASLADADLHVVNSCTVTAEAARSSRRAARAALRDLPGAPPRTVLTGCYATAAAAEAAALPGVDLVVPNSDKHRLLERVREALPDLAPSHPAPLPPELPWRRPNARRGHPVDPANPVDPADPADPADIARQALSHTRALLKIEDGCDMRCSFCIIPSTRGRQRSRPLAEVVEEARGLVHEGYREIVVTGVQISAYRAAAAPATLASAHAAADRLAGLVRALLAVLPTAPLPPLPPVRLRLTSIAPWDLDDELLSLWSDPRLCRHLHLSLQSGADATLRRMRRPYTARRYARLVEGVRAAIPGAAVTTDVIVGFPGETAAEFEESLDRVAALRFAKVHVFPFSPRPGTAAAALPDAPPPAERQRRMARMLAVAARCEADFHRSHLGRRATVLWERPRDGRAQGLTDNYIRVFAAPRPAGRNTGRNQLTAVELVGLTRGGMLGVPAEE